MKNYRAKVKEAARIRDGSPLYNGSLDHAAVLAEEMFANARKDVNILSGSLNAHVYGTPGLVDKARQFLSDKGHKIRIIIENPEVVDADDHLFVRNYNDNDDVEFRSLPKNFEDMDYHFLVMDGDSYRFEKDKNDPSAIAAFGDCEGGSNLTSVFDALWDVSEKYSFN